MIEVKYYYVTKKNNIPMVAYKTFFNVLFKFGADEGNWTHL